MKKFDEFINEDFYTNEDNENLLRIKNRKRAKSFLQKFVIDELGEDVEIAKVKPYKDVTEIIFRYYGDYYLSSSNAKTLKDRLNKTISQIEKVEKVLGLLKIEFEIKQVNKSSDIEITFILNHDYFDENKDLLDSLKGLNKFNM